MPTKTKLERAVKKHAESLGEAQREIVLSQLSQYKRNRARMAEIETAVERLRARTAVSTSDLKAKQAEVMTLCYEFNQLSSANSVISRSLFKQLEGPDDA